MRQPKNAVNGFHNLTSFDGHLVIQAIADFCDENGKFMDEVAYVDKVRSNGNVTEKAVKVGNLRLTVLASSEEKFKSIRFGPLCFIDSLAFLTNSLGNLIESQRKTKSTFQDAFPLMTSFHPQLQQQHSRDAAEACTLDERFEMLLQKIPMPFGWMTDGSCLDTPIRHVVPECFYVGLMKKGISDEKYDLYLRISQKLGFHTFQQWLECYLWTDVLAYADVMESFRRTFHREHGIDPMHYLSAPAASMGALKLKLLRDQVDVELVCELNGGVKLLEHVKANIRGGLCCCYQPYAQANNPFVPGYDAEKERTWLNYVDWTSL
jgi:hypothetical protein